MQTLQTQTTLQTVVYRHPTNFGRLAATRTTHRIHQDFSGVTSCTNPSTAAPQYPELGFYGLAGHTDNPRDLLGEVMEAEQLGLGSVFLSERFNYKDAAVMAGAAAAVSTKIGIANAATNHATRHPVVTATMAATMNRLSNGRYCLGLGRGFDMLFDLFGVPRITNAQLTDATELLRKLWRGEKFGHDGPAGKYPYLFTMGDVPEHIPVLMVAIGPKSAQLAGRIADAVVLHTFMTDETVARSVAAIRRAAEEAGRDPNSVRVWACTAVVEDSIPRRFDCAKPWAGWQPTCRATATSWSRPTAGTWRTCSAFAATNWSAAIPARLTRWGRPSNWNTCATR
jgi:hypothetical protein